MKFSQVTWVIIVTLFFIWRNSPQWAMTLSFTGILDPHNDAPQSIGLLWTSDQLVAETSTWQHTTLTTDRHPCPRWDSNPQSQQTSGRRPTPWTARPLRPAMITLTITVIINSCFNYCNNVQTSSEPIKKSLELFCVLTFKTRGVS